MELGKEIKGEKRENKAGYTAISCGRVGRGGNARLPTFQLDGYGRADGPTDRPTDRRTDKASYRVACPQLKRQRKGKKNERVRSLEIEQRFLRIDWESFRLMAEQMR